MRNRYETVSTVFGILGSLLFSLGCFLLVPLLVALVYGELGGGPRIVLAFCIPAAASFLTGLVLRKTCRAANPSSLQAMLSCSRIRALVRGETAVAFEDVERVATAALRHRVLLNFEGEAEGMETDEIIAQVISTTPKK